MKERKRGCGERKQNGKEEKGTQIKRKNDI
jgi:hypothetical protein